MNPSGTPAQTQSRTGGVLTASRRDSLVEEGRRRRALDETDRLRARFVQSVSHDIRTPLTAIKATASALRVGRVTAAQRAQMLADIETAADRLEQLVANVLDLSRLETGMLKLKRERVPVDELVSTSVVAATLGTDERRIELDLPDDLPVLEIDETLMRQVLVNVLRNAARFDTGGSIRVNARAVGHSVEIRVIDHGPGVPEAERRRLFEPRARRRPAVRGEGTGLGLVISRGFVEANGGTIRIEPTPGGGATAVVAVPVRQP